MDFDDADDVRQVRERTRAVLDRHWPEKWRGYRLNDSIARDLLFAEHTLTDLRDEDVTRLWHALADAGLLGIGVPEEFGGSGGGPLQKYAMMHEIARAGAPFPGTAHGIVLPTLLYIGDRHAIEKFAPAILAGEVEYAVGFTEPGAGSDLASLTTRAVDAGDHWIVSGQKIYSTGAHMKNSVMWTAVRTDPDAPKHRGISVLMIDMSSPGVSVYPLETMSGMRTNAVFFDDVIVPRDHLVGEVNRGWSYITRALASERYTQYTTATLTDAYRLLAEAVGDAPSGFDLERCRAAVRAAGLAAAASAWRAEAGEDLAASASAVKVAVTETRYEIARLANELLGPESMLTERDADGVAQGQLTRLLQHAPISMFAAGTNEVQRDIIATAGLGLPRSS